MFNTKRLCFQPKKKKSFRIVQLIVTLLGTPVDLLIYAIIQAANHVATAYRTRTLVNALIKPQNVEKV